jgi:L-alanine-DL-glutamate epimerase-like enolase superfamily enzyme
MACVLDLKDLIIGSDPMQVEHLYQVMYLGSFYRGGPVLGSAISGIDQALGAIRGKALNMPVYEMLGGPIDARGVRGYYPPQHGRCRPRPKRPEFAGRRMLAKGQWAALRVCMSMPRDRISWQRKSAALWTLERRTAFGKT